MSWICDSCLHNEVCSTYARLGKTDLPESAVGDCVLYAPDNNVGWISVEERLPEPDNTEYIVCCEYHGKQCIEIHKGWNMHSVTHWMSLPEPPKEEV